MLVNSDLVRKDAERRCVVIDVKNPDDEVGLTGESCPMAVSRQDLRNGNEVAAENEAKLYSETTVRYIYINFYI